MCMRMRVRVRVRVASARIQDAHGLVKDEERCEAEENGETSVSLLSRIYIPNDNVALLVDHHGPL
jgi:hypothetical protein